MEQLTTLDVDPGDNDSATRYLAYLKSELADEKAARKEDKDELQTHARACANMKKMADKFTAQVPELEQKVLDGLTKLRAKELSLERTTKANEDYKSQNSRLTKKLESKLVIPFATCVLYFFTLYIYIYILLLTPIQIA
jgi:hypothetical protein